jgi:RNA polymerase sigma-70 factor (ECF subfamily)
VLATKPEAFFGSELEGLSMNLLPATADYVQSGPLVSVQLGRKGGAVSKNRTLSALMRDAQLGNEMAYSLLFEQILPILQKLVRSRLRFLPVADREDLVQDILLSLHAARATYDPQRPFIPWLMAIAHNRMVDHARRNSRRFEREVPIDVLPGEGHSAVAHADSAAYADPRPLWRAIDKLPKSQRIALELLKFSQMSLKEASNATGISIAALRVSSHRALKSLRASLDA